MDFVKDNFVWMMQFVETRKECKRSDYCQRNSADGPLCIRFRRICARVLPLTSLTQHDKKKGGEILCELLWGGRHRILDVTGISISI
jgi:hypothetical protein